MTHNDPVEHPKVSEFAVGYQFVIARSGVEFSVCSMWWVHSEG